MSIRRHITIAGALAVTALAPSTAAAAAGHGGAPVVEKVTIQETYFDDFIFDLCGISTMTTETQHVIAKLYPDGHETVHYNAQWVPEDPRVASERFARTDVIATDGTLTIKGLAIRLYRKGEGTLIRDAGWLRVVEDGLVTRGPHPFILGTDPAEVYC